MAYFRKFLWSVCLGLCLCACDGTYNEPAIGSYTYITSAGHTAGHPVVVDREFNRYWIDDIADGSLSYKREKYVNARNAMEELANCKAPSPSSDAKLIFVNIGSGGWPTTVYAEYQSNFLASMTVDVGEFRELNLYVNEVEQPVYLILSSAGTLWQLQLAEGAKIERIVMIGEPNYAGRRLAVANVPEGVPVQIMDHIKCGLKPVLRPPSEADFKTWKTPYSSSTKIELQGQGAAYSNFLAKMQSVFPSLSRSNIYGFASAVHILVGPSPDPERKISYQRIDRDSFYMTNPDAVYLTRCQKLLGFLCG